VTQAQVEQIRMIDGSLYLQERTANSESLALLSSDSLAITLKNSDGTETVFTPRVETAVEAAAWRSAIKSDLDGNGSEDILVTLLLDGEPASARIMNNNGDLQVHRE